MKPINGIEPPGGHYYIQKWKGVDFRIDAETPENLVGAVIRFRLENNIPTEGTEGDVHEFTCKRVPRFCRGEGLVVAPQFPRQVSLVDRILDWVGSVEDTKLHFRADAEFRAKVCLSCKHNTQWRGGCGTCVQRAERVLMSIRRGNDIPSIGEGLLGCNIHGHDNRTAIWLKNNVKRKENAPKECWM